MIAYLGMGSNSGNPSDTLAKAIKALSSLLTDIRVSPMFRSKAMYVQDQDDFLNCAVAGECSLNPGELLSAIHGIEASLGRDRSKERRMGERAIDIDILLYGDIVCEESELRIPHPGLLERKFALIPLLWLCPSLKHPVSGRNLSDSLESLPDQGIYYSSLQGYSCIRHDE